MHARTSPPSDVNTACLQLAGPTVVGDIAAKTGKEITYKLAEDRWERESAFRLIHDGYLAKGLTMPTESGMRVTRWNLLAATQMYIALEADEVIYTMSLVADDWSGLPLQTLYQDEVDALRYAGFNLAEVTCLSSSKRHDRQRMFDIFVELVALMFQQARRMGIDGLVIAVHPSHADFYGRQLGFTRLGDEKAYPLVDGHPAVLCFHDFGALDMPKYPLYDRIYTEKIAPDRLAPRYMSLEDQEHFLPIAESLASSDAMAVG